MAILKFIKIFLLLLISIYVTTMPVFAASKWNNVVNEVDVILSEAVKAYENNDTKLAKEKVNDAYFGPYEGRQMENAVRINISSKANAEIEQDFSGMKKIILRRESLEKMTLLKAETIKKLRTAAKEMDGAAESPWSGFVESLLIIVREGFEAILVIAALIAYLVKTGNKSKVHIIYKSILFALAASIVTAIAIKAVFKISGASQEILEGVTMLIAVGVLFSVSFWLISKSEAKKWQNYIEGKVAVSLSSGNKFALGFAAFLAVYREGAETALFYQALASGAAPDEIGRILTGFIAGCIILTVLFYLINFGGMKIPLKPFFMITGALLYYLAFVFSGQAVNELQAGNVIGSTTINFPTISFLGIYPTLESLFLQLFLVIAAIGGLIYQKKFSKIIVS